MRGGCGCHTVDCFCFPAWPERSKRRFQEISDILIILLTVVYVHLVSNLIVAGVLSLFAYIFVNLILRDIKSKKKKTQLLSNGIKATGVITAIKSRSGGNSGFINVTVEFEFTAKNGVLIRSASDTVIDAVKTHLYQPGDPIQLIYAGDDPQICIIDTPHPFANKR